jgi:hypothetical protein
MFKHQIIGYQAFRYRRNWFALVCCSLLAFTLLYLSLLFFLPHRSFARASSYSTGLFICAGASRFELIALQSVQNLDYVSSEQNYAGNTAAMLRARASTIGSWETFALCQTSDGDYEFQSLANDRYVSAGQDSSQGCSSSSYSGMLRACASDIQSWEKFQKVTVDGHTAYRSAANNDYVSVQLNYTGGNYAMLRANIPSDPDTSEEFTVYCISSDCSF